MKRGLTVKVLLIGFWVISGFLGTAYPADSPQLNTVRIVSPRNGETVGVQGVMKGTARVTDGSHVWILVHPRLLTDQWWPQIRPRIEENGNWEALAYFGRREDIGLDFEIAVATFDQAAEREILQYHQDGQRTGQWMPIRFPRTTSNIEITTVRKVSH